MSSDYRRYPDRSPDFDDKVPDDRVDGESIRDWLDDEHPSLPDDFAQGLADDIEEKRQSSGSAGAGVEGEGLGGDEYFDPDTGRWRDSETGQFVSKE